MTCNDFSEGLLAYFRPVFSIRQYRDQLAACRQETEVADYIDCFHNIIMKIPNVTEDEKIDHFVRSLVPQARSHVLSYVPEEMINAEIK